MAKKVYFNKEARSEFQKGINTVADAVGSTLGARGMGVMISNGYGHFPFVTKDGVTVANNLFLDEEIENTGAMFLREAASKTLALAGDGTTTTVVLAQNILNNGLVSIDGGANAQEIRSGVEKAVDCVVTSLKEMSVSVDNNDMIKNIATVSGNNDIEIGGHIADLYSKVGNSVMIDIKKSATFKTYTETLDGAEILAGYSNEGFCNDFKKMEAVFENPLIFVTNYEIKTIKEMEPFLQSINNNGIDLSKRGIIFIAAGFEGEFHNTMLVGKSKQGIKSCLIQAPSAYQKEMLRDVCALTGATLICDEMGAKLQHATVNHCGTCEKIIISRWPTLIINGAGDKLVLEQLKSEIKAHIESTDNAQVKEISEKRLARLCGSVGVIYVGGSTTTEMEERIARVDDAVRATKSAVEEGIVAGGGVALIRCMDKLKSIEVKGDESVGVELVRLACMAPLTKMLSNAGALLSIVDNVILEKGNIGYNVKTSIMEDLVVSGIIDPVKVIRCALQSASSVAIQVITSNALLVEMKPLGV